MRETVRKSVLDSDKLLSSDNEPLSDGEGVAEVLREGKYVGDDVLVDVLLSDDEPMCETEPDAVGNECETLMDDDVVVLVVGARETVKLCDSDLLRGAEAVTVEVLE